MAAATLYNTFAFVRELAGELPTMKTVVETANVAINTCRNKLYPAPKTESEFNEYLKNATELEDFSDGDPDWERVEVEDASFPTESENPDGALCVRIEDGGFLAGKRVTMIWVKPS